MEKQIMTKKIDKGDFASGGEASSKLKNLLRKLGVESLVLRKVAIITYELEMNIIIHSEGGRIKALVDSEGLKLYVEDKGPGIKNLDKALQPGFSTASDEIREMGFGAGMGLNNVQKYADKLKIDTAEGEGTSVTAFINFQNGEE